MSTKLNAKSVAYFQSKKEAATAKASASRFTKKQSQYERKHEEAQVQQSFDMSRFEVSRRRTVGGQGGADTLATASTLMPNFNRGGGTGESGNAKRRRDLYQLDDRRLDDQPVGLSGAALGVARVAPDSSILAEDGEPPQKMSRHEKFEEVIHKSRVQRAEVKRERANRDKETVALDEEFNLLSHLLPKRDKKEELRAEFEAGGNAEVRKMLEEHREKRTEGSRLFSLTANGGLVEKAHADTSVVNVRNNAGPLTEEDKKLLQKITNGKSQSLAAKPTAAATTTPSAKPSTVAQDTNEEEDDFDLLLGQMRRDVRRAVAADRTLTEEEEAEAADRQRLLQEDRSGVPMIDVNAQHQLTRGEWLAQGGDKAYRMDEEEGDEDEEEGEGSSDEDDDDDGAGSLDDFDGVESADSEHGGEDEGEAEEAQHPAAAAVGSAAVDQCIAQLESLAAMAASMTTAERNERFQSILLAFHTAGKRQAMHTAQLCRAVLMDIQAQHMRGKPLTDLSLLLLMAISNIYPMTDYRHEVVTPLWILLCSCLVQCHLETLRDVKVALVLSSMLVEAMHHANKYCAEMLVVPLNVISLQVPRSIVEPRAHQGTLLPCPMVQRCEAALLAATPEERADASLMKSRREGMVQALSIFTPDRELSKEQLLFAAYRLVASVATQQQGGPGFEPGVAEPVLTMDKRLFADSSVHPSLRETHAAMLTTLTTMRAAANQNRTPLAMRTFRPRPIRLFDPLLVENVDPAVKEHRELKKELREDKKRLVRSVQAEATVERRARERDAAAEDSRRQAKYNELMGELQAQQHIMKTVDMNMAKSRSKSRKGVSGESNQKKGESDE